MLFKPLKMQNGDVTRLTLGRTQPIGGRRLGGEDVTPSSQLVETFTLCPLGPDTLPAN